MTSGVVPLSRPGIYESTSQNRIVGNISYKIDPKWGVTFNQLGTSNEGIIPLLRGYNIIELSINGQKKIALKKGDAIISIDEYLALLGTAEAHNELIRDPNWQDNFQSHNPTKAPPTLPICFHEFKTNFPRDFFATKQEIERVRNTNKVTSILQ